ncbi:MAG: hypothetical protein GWN67_02815, partial [Phycisphaerae bacterium]|nr:VCBS repeat-containing protein [Phycisphaerae bacterium]NIS50078.1 VCBS repeat-containing protein [Phycisphaerae bacterium]NIU07733.1 VCBS repeat-containing protein [Phycisphaerae bacterium]NIU55357.1 hypothetical protein [Phycisphaerae bacterium]NIW91824.1 hypothetical protein [Phycisphaerae bacterium]
MRDKSFSLERRSYFTPLTWIILSTIVYLSLKAPALSVEFPWRSPNNHRLLLSVDARRTRRSNSPASVNVDFVKALSDMGISGIFDEHTIEVIAYDSSGSPKIFDSSRDGYERYLLPWHIQKLYRVNEVTLSFVMPDESCTTFAVYFDTDESGLARPKRCQGLVGDGDFFRESYGRREIGAHHFDTFCDLDGDGDLDLFKGGVEPFIYCYENVGDNHLVEAGRLTSAGKLFELPRNKHNNRSWVVPHFYDWDRDGDDDFFPSFMSGPYAGKIVFFENTTKSGGQLTFVDRGPMKTISGVPLAGGKQAGGWFPSVVFVVDFDGDDDDLTDIILGNNNHCYLYRNLGPDGAGRWRLADAVTIQAGGEDIELFNPCFDVADIDNDGDWDLFGAPQAGQIYFYENADTGNSRTQPTFAKGIIIAYDETYLQRSTHPRVTVADFTGDG